MRQPKSFTEVEGWRESFEQAANRQESTRASSLFPEVPQTLCGVSVRALTRADWTLMDIAENPFTAGGKAGLEHASNLVWLVRKRWRWVGHGRFSKWLRRLNQLCILTRCRFDEERVIDEVSAFVEDAFLDLPGQHSADDGKSGFSPVNMPQVSSEVKLCGEIMAQFPSFRYAELRTMPLAQFWQWLNAARKQADPEYRLDQLTDRVNRDACAELNRIKKEAREAKAA